MNDPVNHPSHYTSHPSGIEAIEVTRHMPFDEGTAIKYLWRAGLKPIEPGASDERALLMAKVQDLKKAAWYVGDALTLAENELIKLELRVHLQREHESEMETARNEREQHARAQAEELYNDLMRDEE